MKARIVPPWLAAALAGLAMGATLGSCVSTVQPIQQMPSIAPGRTTDGEEVIIHGPAATAASPKQDSSAAAPPAPTLSASPQASEAAGFSAIPFALAPSSDLAVTPDIASLATPATTPTEIPPALDVGNVAPGVQISDQPLAPLLAAAAPARAASLRIVDGARAELIAGDPTGAIRSLTHALSIDPSDPFAYFYLGRAYFAKKNYSQAVTFLHRAEIGFAPDPAWLAEALGFEGSSLELAGRPSEALAAYKRALDASPGNLTALAGYTRLAGAAPSADASGSALNGGLPPGAAIAGPPAAPLTGPILGAPAMPPPQPAPPSLPPPPP